MPRAGFTLGKMHSIEAGPFELCEEFVFSPRPGDTTGPQLWIIFHVLRYIFIGNNVADCNSPPLLNNSIKLAEKLCSVLRLD